MSKYIYTGVFFDYSVLMTRVKMHITKEMLSNIIENPHVTFAYKPEDDNMANRSSLFGIPLDFEVIGYGCDGKNQGLQVRLIKDGYKKDGYIRGPKLELEFLYDFFVKNPHITISVSDDGKPVDTGKLEFMPIAETFLIRGSYGGYTYDGGYDINGCW